MFISKYHRKIRKIIQVSLIILILLPIGSNDTVLILFIISCVFPWLRGAYYGSLCRKYCEQKYAPDSDRILHKAFYSEIREYRKAQKESKSKANEEFPVCIQEFVLAVKSTLIVWPVSFFCMIANSILRDILAIIAAN